ncbi:hypothetical protein CAGGBEG34_200111 [Candidatus Glomeribacter gigasporarum BEG34]|uniref:Uncharacterized protein n=1 Tax=Candidatus Glomeribacter gigasporarum BEG34 TaxID=1070319 RepID=G2J8L0_9BURK|nr:hypothetical protein [Candidatus Glomeribacter gigasporarum]CCD29107.1 hypothetical protein CAGGBEG34_200111 [Candidatus Glomeribacter gigasporarum BEG34]
MLTTHVTNDSTTLLPSAVSEVNPDQRIAELTQDSDDTGIDQRIGIESESSAFIFPSDYYVISAQPIDAVQDQGKWMTVVFNDGEIQHEKYSMAQLMGDIPSFTKVGALPGIDLENIKHFNQKSIEWAFELGAMKTMDSSDPVYRKLLKLGSASAAAYFFPGVKLEESPLPNYLMVFYVLFDDVVDNPQFQQSTDYKKSSQKRSMHLKRFYPLENSSPNRLISRFLSRSASFC